MKAWLQQLQVQSNRRKSSASICRRMNWTGVVQTKIDKPAYSIGLGVHDTREASYTVRSSISNRAGNRPISSNRQRWTLYGCQRTSYGSAKSTQIAARKLHNESAKKKRQKYKCVDMKEQKIVNAKNSSPQQTMASRIPSDKHQTTIIDSQHVEEWR